jgi:bifunctional NMN adenylyltransferase/nudix hydrolase
MVWYSGTPKLSVEATLKNSSGFVCAKEIKNELAPSTMEFLEIFKKSDKFAQLVREKEFIEKYKSQYSSLPYPPIFVTTDAVVVQSGHVLLVKRRAEPGKGLWAFPGGFVNAAGDKSIEDAMLRELNEETNIKLPEKVLRGSIEKVKVFDSPTRSKRGRTITHAFYIHLKDGEWNLPKIRASDDAEKAEWVPLHRVKSDDMFEDHVDILQYFIGSF